MSKGYTSVRPTVVGNLAVLDDHVVCWTSMSCGGDVDTVSSIAVDDVVINGDFATDTNLSALGTD